MASFLVIGMGRFGSSVANELHHLGHEVMVIDEEEENISAIADSVTETIIGDAKDEAVLGSLGVQNFDCVVVAMAGTIEDSILITLMLKEMNVKKVVCKAQNERHAKILTLIGADSVIKPEFEMGIRVAHSLVRKNIVEQMELSPEVSVVEILTPKQWSDKSIMKNNLRRKYGITVIAIRKKDSKKVKFSPNADVVINEGDILTVIGSAQDINTINMLK